MLFALLSHVKCISCAAYWTAVAAAVVFSFTLRSLRPLGVGEELTISYGAEKPNCEALRDYGFVLTGNGHDRTRFGSTTAAATSTADPASTQAAASLHGLNEACLLEVREGLVGSAWQFGFTAGQGHWLYVCRRTSSSLTFMGYATAA